MIDWLILGGLAVGIVYFIVIRQREKREEKFEKRRW
jgi:preprotein translocase subunit YajC